jgi:hypothetical protein
MLVADLDVADRSYGNAASSTPAEALPFLMGTAATPAAEGEACLCNRNHRYTLTLNGLAEDRRSLSLFADPLTNPLEEIIDQL